MTGYTFGPHLHFETWYIDDQFKTIYTSPSFTSSTKTPIRLSKNLLVNQDGAAIKEAPKPSLEALRNSATEDRITSNDTSLDSKELERKVPAPEEIGNTKKIEVADSILFNLGNNAYRKGDYKQAFIYFSKSARAYNPAAQLNLGILYLKGEGVIKDEANAYLWFDIARHSSNPEVRHNAGQRLFRLAGRMNSKDLIDAKNLVEACKRTKLANCGR